MATQFCGLDGEMTGTYLSKGHKLIQIGVAYGRELFVSDIGWRTTYKWTQEALDVNGFSHYRIRQGPSAEYVDKYLVDWFKGIGATRGSVIPIGWNVASFDMPFVRDALPKSSFYISRRAVDLNAICFTLGGALDLGGVTPGWKGWKRRAKSYAEEELTKRGVKTQWHDAGYDALTGLIAWEWFREVVQQSAEGLSPAAQYGLRKAFQREEQVA